MNWKARIVELVFVKQTMHELAPDGLWEFRLPGTAATSEQLDAVEEHLGEPLDSGYRAFLEHAGGWPAFWQTVDLFGPQDLMGSDRFRHGVEMLQAVEENVLTDAGVSLKELLPIAVSPFDLDLFVMTRTSSAAPGQVIWLAGSEIDRWPDFGEFFLAMVDYNRLELQQLQPGAGGSA